MNMSSRERVFIGSFVVSVGMFAIATSLFSQPPRLDHTGWDLPPQAPDARADARGPMTVAWQEMARRDGEAASDARPMGLMEVRRSPVSPPSTPPPAAIAVAVVSPGAAPPAPTPATAAPILTIVTPSTGVAPAPVAFAAPAAPVAPAPVAFAAPAAPVAPVVAEPVIEPGPFGDLGHYAEPWVQVIDAQLEAAVVFGSPVKENLFYEMQVPVEAPDEAPRRAMERLVISGLMCGLRVKAVRFEGARLTEGQGFDIAGGKVTATARGNGAYRVRSIRRDGVVLEHVTSGTTVKLSQDRRHRAER